MNQQQPFVLHHGLIFVGLGAAMGVLGVGLLIGGGTPWQWPNLVFFSLVAFLVALYRPSWGFLGLVAMLPFETLNLIEPGLGLMLRPYQWMLVLLGLALVVRLITQRLTWPLFSPQVIDFTLALIPLGALLSGWINGGEGLRLGVIVTSFYGLYLVSRMFLRSAGDIQALLWTLVSSGVITTGYGLVQNIAFERGWNWVVTMPGRPNGSFSEPDWLGFFVVLLLALTLSWLDQSLGRILKESSRPVSGGWLPILGGSVTLALILIVLILTVSRSAWLAAIAAVIGWFSLSIFVNGRVGLSHVLHNAQLLVITFVVALLVVVDVPLTRFDLFNRAASTATGWQTITIACTVPASVPDRIQSVAELESYGCQHIDLEVISEYHNRSEIQVLTVDRPDPNVEIRSSIYQTTWSEITRHPIVGIGWGNIGNVLGRDERGAAYNASNVWLELALGAGVLGVLGLAISVGIISYRLLRSLWRFTANQDDSFVSGTVLALSLLSAFLVFNLFNSGLLIGCVWVGFAAIVRWSALLSQPAKHS